MSIELLRGELERLFSLDELKTLSSDLLGFSPSEIGGAASKASFARALTERFVELDAVEALAEAVLTLRAEVDPRLREVERKGVGDFDDLRPADEFGPFVVTKKIGEGPRAVVYQAQKEGADRVLKVFRRQTCRDRRSLHRFLLRVRLATGIEHEGLPANVETGLVRGRAYVAYDAAEGHPITARIARTGQLHINEARPILISVLASLTALHEKGFAHGAVKADNVIVSRDTTGATRTLLVDMGGDRLAGAFSLPAIAKATSPEMFRGKPADASSDLYQFGLLAFELLAGKPAFSSDNAADLVSLHLTVSPPAVSALAPRGWVPKELDDLLAKLLSKAPTQRPTDARAVSQALVSPGDLKAAQHAKITSDEIDERVDALLADPTDGRAALNLESALDLGADCDRIADAFQIAADQVDEGDDEVGKLKAREFKKALLFRAARIYDTRARNLEKAEHIYATVVDLDEDDEVAFAALEEIRRTLRKHEELVEMLLAKSERATSHRERARALNQIGQVYLRDIDDKEQATFAFAKALAQDTLNDSYASDLERAAGHDLALWSEALEELSQASLLPDMPPEAKVALFTRLGRWYSENVARPDLGVPCFQAVLAVDPAHDGALEGLAQVYRRAQQWQELGQVLIMRADRAPTAAVARDMRAEAANLLETKLNEPTHARDLYETIVADDPSHEKASEGLTRIYSRLEDYAGLAKILARRAEVLSGEPKAEAICKLAELYEDRLNDLAEATRRYESAITFDSRNLSALKGLDRIYNRTGKYKELIGNLERQAELAATPRQKIGLLERIAGIEEEEFLNHANAARALEAVIAIDPAHQSSLTSLVRHYRSLSRWEDVVTTYESLLHLITEDKERFALHLAMGRVLLEELASPERARRAYEKALEIDPNHSGALESLASVRAATGDAMAALSAVESLAENAASVESRAELWIRAAKILEDMGDRDGAIDRYKRALDAQPKNFTAWSQLRTAYLARGDAHSAVDLMMRTVEQAEGKLAKARLYGDIAQVVYERLHDKDRARDAATKAVDLDPTNMLGLLITGDLAFDEAHFIEAAKSYESLSGRLEALPKESAVRLLIRYVDALSKSGSTEKAIGTVKTLLELAPDDPEALGRAGQVNFDANKLEEAAAIYEDLLNRFGADLAPATKAVAMLRFGESKLRLGDMASAMGPLHEAADLAPESSAPLELLCKLFEEKKDWEEVVRLKTRRLDVVSGEERSTLLLEIGDVLASQMGDRTRAAKSFVAALDERPDDRKILTKLMQLYSEEKDWGKLVDVVLKLASKVEDRLQKAKYLHTAAIVTARQLGDGARAQKFYEEVIDLDPTLEKAWNELVGLRTASGDYEGVETLLKAELDRAAAATNTARCANVYDQLGALYKDKLGWTNKAVDALEAAQSLDPENDARNERLAELYASDPSQYLDKAVRAQVPMLRRAPYRPESYKLLRKLYTETKHADAAWCMCQALVSMSSAEPDEERFYLRMRSDGPASAEEPLTTEDWALRLMHQDADPLVTEIFAIIQSAVLKKNGQPLEALGYNLADALDLERHPYPMSQTLAYAAGVMGMAPPVTFENPNDPSGLIFLHGHVPAVVLGAAALAAEVPAQAAAFIGARHLCYYRPGLYLRHLVPTGTGLRAWLFAAIKLITPAFPIAKDIEGPVKENLGVLEPMLVGAQRDLLASDVTKLLQTGAIDLKKWVAAVDLTADRIGFVVANDLELTNEMIRSADEASSAVPQKDRLKELLLFAASEQYFAMRQRLGINIDA